MQERDEDAFELAPLRASVSEDEPVGRDLDGTLALDALETAVREPDEPSIAGVERVDARDWRAIEADARALLRTSKDLRVGVILSRALSERHGLAGFAAGVTLLADLVEQHWTAIYPRPDEDGDPTIRVNALRELASAAQLTVLRGAELASAPGIGRFSINDALVASESPAARASEAPPAREHVLAAIDALGGEGVYARLADVRRARDALRALVARVSRETGRALPVAELVAPEGERRPALFDALEALLAAQLARLAPVAQAPAQAGDAGGARAVAPNDGAVRSREDVLRVLDGLVAYYARAEPSSPVPLLLKRARRLATMDFLQIVEDLAREGMPQVALVAGMPGEPTE